MALDNHETRFEIGVGVDRCQDVVHKFPLYSLEEVLCLSVNLENEVIDRRAAQIVRQTQDHVTDDVLDGRVHCDNNDTKF